MLRTVVILAAAAALLIGGPAIADAEYDALAREILAELVAANTAPSGGNDTRGAVALLAEHLRDGGFDAAEIHVLGAAETLPNLVVRLRSAAPRQRPILMMAHIDVVEALPEDWTVEPFVMTERDGYYYGRGTTDNKAGAAILVTNLIRFKREGFQPNRDLVVMLTADEETTGDGVQWLLAEHRALIEAEFALNTDGGLIVLKDDEARAFMMQTAEKVYVTYTLEALDPGGHSSLPRADSAISRLARMLVDLQDNPFPIDLSETTRAFFKRWAGLAPPAERELLEAVVAGGTGPELSAALARAPYYNALARTTCVATQLSAGHAENALPQSARAIVNCRVLPHSSLAVTRERLEALAGPHRVSVTQIAGDWARTAPPSPLDAKVVGPVTAVARELWPDIPVIPEMSTGATDGLFVRNAGIPVYGVSAIAEDPDDIRAHGQDERIRIQSFRDATEYWYRLVRHLAEP